MSKRLNLKDKMQQINERFSYKNKATLANDVLQNKLSNIKKKMTSFALKNQQQMTALKSDALQLLSTLEQNNIQYQLQAQAQVRELQQLSQQLTSRIQSEIVLRKQKQGQLVQVMQKKLRVLRGDLQKQKRERLDIVEQITATLKNDVPSLMNEVVQNTAARQEEEEKLGEIIEGELAECEGLARAFKERQEEGCGKVYALIRELTLKAKREVEEEKAVRDQTHEEILSYIEQTCSKLADP